MEQLKFKVTGILPLLMNNPQSVDPFNRYAKAKKVLTSKRVKTDEDLLEIRRLDIESKLYIDKSANKIYIPSSWITAAIGGVSFKQAKIAKKDIRSGVFADDSKIFINYTDMHKVRAKADVSGNPDFFHTMILKQGQVRIAKSSPIFHDWNFETSVSFDPTVIDRNTLIGLLKHACQYGGFGDFRPTFGMSEFEELAA